MYGIVVHPEEFGKTRGELMQNLKEKGIDTRYFFKPMHNQKLLRKFSVEDEGDYPVTEWLSQNGFYLPSSSGLKPEDIKYVCQKIKGIHQKG
jgi:perosamine synthetase